MPPSGLPLPHGGLTFTRSGSQPQAAARRRRKLIVQVGLTVAVVVGAVVLVLAMVIGGEDTPLAGRPRQSAR